MKTDENPLDERGRQVAFDLERAPSYAAEDFIVSASNALAFAHVQAFPDWPSPLSLIVGPAKSGKTHLARIWAQRSGALRVEVGSIDAEAEAARTQPLLIEDADRAGYSETALFHLLNQAMRANRPVLMTARSGPAQWPLLTDDVRSRIRLAAQFRVESPDDTQLTHMLAKLFSDRQLRVDPKVLSYLVPRMERTPREAVALVELMDRLALVRKCKINRSLGAEAIALRAQVHKMTDNHRN